MSITRSLKKKNEILCTIIVHIDKNKKKEHE